MTGKQTALLAGTGSGALLLAALGFQAAGYRPCELCILQRWPHLAAVVIAGLIVLTGRLRLLAVLGLIAASVATGLAIYHTGVEAQWWPGPQHCSGGIGDIGSISAADLLAQIEGTAVVRCDEVVWSLFGISMAGWNAICSGVLTVLWALSFRKA